MVFSKGGSSFLFETKKHTENIMLKKKLIGDVENIHFICKRGRSRLLLAP